MYDSFLKKSYKDAIKQSKTTSLRLRDFGGFFWQNWFELRARQVLLPLQPLHQPEIYFNSKKFMICG
jgi:hypothetical protein